MSRERDFDLTKGKMSCEVKKEDISDKNKILITSMGVVEFSGPLSKTELERFSMDQDLRNFRPAKKQYEALKYIAKELDGLVFVASHKDTIIGYVNFLKPELPRWARAYENELPELLEMGSFEVSMKWRKEGVGKVLLEWSFNNYDFENNIIISVERVHNWKLMDPEDTVWDHEKMLKKVLGHVGFQQRRTNEPEVIDHPANMFSVRIGNNVSHEAINKFKKLLLK